MKADTFSLARDIVQGKWLVAYPEKLLPIARAFLSKASLEMEVRPSEVLSILDPDVAETGAKRIAVIPLHGTMTKYDTCESMGTLFIAKQLKEAADDDSVVGVVLDIDSGGGSSSAVPPMLEAIRLCRAAGKKVFAHVDGCGSAAYWVASQCDAVYMDNPLSEVGSIGSMAILVDDTAPDPQTGEKLVVVYARESKDKNLSYREALKGNYDPVMDELSPLVKQFQDDVINGRPGLKKDADGVLTGRMFLPDEAVRLGMADAVHTLSETVEALFAISEMNP